MASSPQSDEASSITPRGEPGPPNDRLEVLGVGISPLNLSRATGQIESWITDARREYVCLCTVHGVMESQKSERVRDAFNRAGMVTPDGMPLVWLLRRSGHHDSKRVYGPDLMLATIARGIDRGWRHYLYGGRDDVVDRLVSNLSMRYPEMKVVGRSAPPIAPVEDLASDQTAQKINQVRPDIVWVGLGSPKQDLWMAAMRGRLTASVLVGVGAAFDIHAGSLRQAPGWMREGGFEWAFRLSQEPRRLWRRYLINNPWFIYEITRKSLRRRLRG